MAFPCLPAVRPPPRAVGARAERPRGRRPALTVVAAGTRTSSGAEARGSLVLALVSQALAASQRRAVDLVTEAAKYTLPSGRFEPRTLEEALMSGQCLPKFPTRGTLRFAPKLQGFGTCLLKFPLRSSRPRDRPVPRPEARGGVRDQTSGGDALLLSAKVLFYSTVARNMHRGSAVSLDT
jgi:hypothetical protein